MIDLYTSRRDKFNECEYWSQDELDDDIKSNNKIIYNSTPTGTFLAKEANSYSIESQVLGETFMMEENSITIETSDDVSDLKRNDFVKFDDNLYRVANIQKSIKKSQRQFMRIGYSSNYIISLRR